MTSASLTPRRGIRSAGWKIPAVGALAIVVVLGLLVRQAAAGSRTPVPETVPVEQSEITASVSGIGAIAAAQSVDLGLPSGGRVTEVLVKLGDTVAKDQPLIYLDDRALQSQVISAQASLDAAKLKAEQASSGDANPQDLAAARAALASAQANLDKLRAGPAAADVASAEAALKNAEAHQKEVLAGPTDSEVSAARASVQSAQAQLTSAQKTLADLQAQPRADDVKAAQLALEQAKDTLWSTQVSRDATCGASGADSAPCKSANASVGAQETAVNAAAAKLEATQKPATPQDLASAQQAVQSAQAGLASAQAKLAQVEAGPTSADRQAAQTQVDQAKASLTKLQTAVTPNDLTVAQASVDQAQANLDKLTASASATDQAIAQASVTQAEEALKQAKINLDNATLRAPFAGIITAVNVVPGSIGGAGAAISLVDRSALHVDLKLSENDVVKVSLNQPVTLTSDILAKWSAPGKVTYIAPAGTVINGVSTYAVRANFDDPDPQLRVGMNVNVSIITAHKDNALLVPSTALLPKGSGRVVQRLSADGKTIDEVEVVTGLTDGAMTEIISGLKPGDQIVPLPNLTPNRRPSGAFGG